ncbi:hypothetical protein 2 [Hubei tombus-like virus 9]|uniref:hypothetical protein 2 n=1 Tax=Hubei tombus-like virus 9 TaxID=1923296 RepID=UPI00090AD699|nr:hypothetical protein 2 [Hubei tombus-like virus 9]APG76491.1 hypothetical protein 2 [Hubei tombus-like virus 9]
MARKKQMTKPRARRSRKQGKKSSAVPVPKRMLELAELLHNPCDADIPRGIYPGEVGAVERFIWEQAFVGVNNTACFYAFHPNTGAIIYSNQTTSSGALAMTTTASFAPGQTFLSANAAKVRGLAACIQVACSSLSVTAITGEISLGVLTADVVTNNLLTTTTDQWFNMLQARGPISRDIKEVKWYPGLRDNSFTTYNGSLNSLATLQATGSDLSDTHVVCIAIRNVPVGTTINVRTTYVAEWSPKLTVGITPSTAVSPGTNHLAAANILHKSKPNWFHNAGSGLGNAASGFATAFMQSVGQNAADQTMKYITSAGANAGNNMARRGTVYAIEELAEELGPRLLTL